MTENFENKTCPGCGRHCDLSDPHCGRGRAYAETGILPERRHGEGEHPHHHHHHDHGTISERLLGSLRELDHMMRFKHEGKGGQMRILTILNRTGGMTQRALTEQLGIQPGSASEILAKLENSGFITRTPNEEDRRTTDIALTEEGRKTAAQAAEEREKRREEMFACLSEEEKQTLLALLQKLEADWRERFPENEHRHGPHHDSHGEHRPHHGHHEGHGSHHGPHDKHEGDPSPAAQEL